jgi:Ca2+-binding EF-hand superfamily protein
MGLESKVMGVALGCALFASMATAQGAVDEAIQAAFSEADNNGDGAINVDEYVAHTVVLFEAAGGTDTREVPRSALQDVNAADFNRADRDRNGALSLGEVVADKMIDFFETDANHDGVLSPTEVVAGG